MNLPLADHSLPLALLVFSTLIGSGIATLWFYHLDAPYFIKRYIIRTKQHWKPIKPLDCLNCTVFWFQVLVFSILSHLSDLPVSEFIITLPAIFATARIYTKLIESHE